MSLVLRFLILIWATAELTLWAESSDDIRLAIFTGRVLADELAVSTTNGISGVVYDVRVARIRIESVTYYDYYEQPIPLRIPDEVSIYYHFDKDRLLRLSDGHRRTVQCYRGNFAGRTNVVIALPL